MRKLKKISLIVLIPIIIGVVLLVVGSRTGNKSVSLAGQLILSAGTFVTMFILVVICLILMMTGRLEDDEDKSEKKKQHTRESKDADIDDEDSSCDLDDDETEAERFAKSAGKRYKNSTNKEKIWGWLFFAFLMTDFFLIPVFAFFKIYIGALVCFCLFVGTILICALFAGILQNCSLKIRVRKMEKMKMLCGKVKECLLLKENCIGKLKRNSATSHPKMKYKVIVSAEGNDYIAYSEKIFEKDEIVVIDVKRRRKASIVDMTKLKAKIDSIKARYNIENKQE